MRTSFILQCHDRIFSTGEYKTILQLVGVLSHGKIAKRLTDRAVDLMQDVQNLRKAIYEFVAIPWSINIPRLIRAYSSLYLATNWRLTHVKKAPSRRRNCGLLQSIICELSIKIESAAGECLTRYRYGTLIVFANYLIEMRQSREGPEATFPEWLRKHREIAMLLSRTSLD